MDMIMPLFFYILGFLLLVIGLLEEKYVSHGDEDSSDELVVLTLVLSTVFLFLAGITTWYITDSYYSPQSDSIIETEPLSQYRPIGWIGIGFALFCGLLTAIKIFDVIGKESEG